MRVCENCRDYMYPNCAAGQKAKYCWACKVVTYCSKCCQEAHWPNHRQECGRLRRQAEMNKVPQELVYGSSRSSSDGPTDASGAGEPRLVRAKCGLCGSRKGLFEVTPCCGRILCKDQDEYELMSYGRNSCSRNHWRYTICHAHYLEDHSGRWQDCTTCRGRYDALTFYGLATNHPDLASRCNFPDQVLNEPLPPLPRCHMCKKEVDTRKDGHSTGRNGLSCLRCIGME